jgi:ribonuclease G
MPKLILMNPGHLENRVAILDNDRIDEFFIERGSEKTIVGNIYKARVDSIAPSLNAAFVDIGLPKKGFLYLSKVDKAMSFSGDDLEAIATSASTFKTEDLKVGQELIVQVVKEQFGTKGPRLTTNISLPGRYLVLLPFDHSVGISRRIDDEEERRRLRVLIDSLNFPKESGFVVRTVSVGVGKKQLVRDAKFLIRLWQTIYRQAQKRKAPALVHEEYDLLMRIVRDSFTEDIANLFVDSKREFYIIRRFVRIYSPDLLRKIIFYHGKELLFEKFKVEEKIETLYQRKVNLKSGGYIYIEPTEGLVAIDVNSGKYRGNISSAGPRAQEEMAFNVNMEAADEISRQLRLRDLGGLIVIDFIDMSKDSNRKALVVHFKDLLKTDRAKTEVIRISDFGILEMTRQRQRKSAEGLSFQACPYCLGKGKVKSTATVAIMCLRALSQALKERKKPKLLVSLNPQVVEFLNVQHIQTLKDLQSRFRTPIILNPSPHLHLEKIIIE